MAIIQDVRQRLIHIPGPEFGVRVTSGYVSGGADWWDPDGSIGAANYQGAYRAINTPGSPWSGGPSAYADTLINLANPGINDLIEGNGAVPWAAGTGWTFVAAALKYFNTGLVPANTQAWSMFIRYANVTTNNRVLCGVIVGVNRFFFLQAIFTLVQIRYANGGTITVAPQLPTGNLGVAGNRGYRNGVAEGGAIPAWGGASADPIFIGCYNSGGGIPAAYMDGDVESFAVYSCTLSAPQVALVTAAMAAL